MVAFVFSKCRQVGQWSMNQGLGDSAHISFHLLPPSLSLWDGSSKLPSILSLPVPSCHYYFLLPPSLCGDLSTGWKRAGVLVSVAFWQVIAMGPTPGWQYHRAFEWWFCRGEPPTQPRSSTKWVWAQRTLGFVYSLWAGVWASRKERLTTFAPS